MKIEGGRRWVGFYTSVGAKKIIQWHKTFSQKDRGEKFSLCHELLTPDGIQEYLFDIPLKGTTPHGICHLRSNVRHCMREEHHSFEQ